MTKYEIDYLSSFTCQAIKHKNKIILEELHSQLRDLYDEGITEYGQIHGEKYNIEEFKEHPLYMIGSLSVLMDMVLGNKECLN